MTASIFNSSRRTFLSGTSGLQYATNSYDAFGNNGTHAINQPINTGTAQPPAVLNALAGILDHLPIVADYLLRPRSGLAHPGDATLDLSVNLDDFTALASSFGGTSATWQQGDFNDDAAVSLDDFTILAANFGTVASASQARVPEPRAVDTWGSAAQLGFHGRSRCRRL